MVNWAEKATSFATKTARTPERRAAGGCPSEVVCRCLGVTSTELNQALDVFNAQSVEDLREQTGAGGGCTACHRVLRQVIAARNEQQPAVACRR